MVSLPSFEPQSFVEGISTDEFQELIENKAFNNLAIQGQFSPGSSFKAITYFTAMDQGIFAYSPALEGPLTSDNATLSIPSDGRIVFPFRQEGDEASQLLFPDSHCNGWDVDLHYAFEESCNGYFWATAYALWEEYKGTENEGIIQDHARLVGLGSPTGVDLPFEASGLMPDRELYLRWAEESPNRLADFRTQLPGAIWVGGDLLNLAIGQGDVLATPLQMAVSFSSLSTGRVYEPHVVRRVEDADGRAVQVIRPRLIRTLDVPDSFLTTFRTDLARVTTNGTAKEAFDVMDKQAQVGGKTGTADHAAGKLPHSWFVGVAPVQAPRYVVAVVVEEGGGGGSIAAHTARAILQYLLDEEVDPIIDGGVLGSPMPWELPDEEPEQGEVPDGEEAVLPEDETP
jgi:penicillin-binding protein 2